MLLSYENEALFAERNGEDVEHVTPDTTFKIENPVAVVNTSKNKAKAQAFVDFLYTPEGQKAWAEAGFRPGRRDPSRSSSPPTSRSRRSSTRSTTWAAGARSTTSCSSPRHGSVAKIYDEATG